MRVKVIVFDLDDTLYDEIEYVKSGFLAVAQNFCEADTVQNFYQTMIKELEKNGRGKVFDTALQEYKLYSKKAVRKALSIYRTHLPKLTLPQESQEILEYFLAKKTPLYIVTDGNKIVQANKLKALQLHRFIKKSFITHRYGKIHAKPSPYCFEKIAKLEGVAYSDVVYIGDNINKDFVGIKKLGFRTIRIKKGMFADLNKTQEYHAEVEIDSLYALKNILKDSIANS